MLQCQVGTERTGLGQKKWRIVQMTQFSGRKNSWTHPQHMNKQWNLIHAKGHAPIAQRKQVKQASLPQIPVPLRRTPGSSYSALPVGPHSCQTRGCMWSTSSDRALSSGKCLQAGHSRPCTQNSKVKWSIRYFSGVFQNRRQWWVSSETE